MSRIASIAATLALTAEAGYRWDGCPTDFKPMEGPLDMDRYAGKWYEIARDKWYLFEIFQMCGNYEYSTKEDGSYQVVYNRWTPQGDWSDSRADVSPSKNVDGAAICVDFDQAPDYADIPTYQVVDTDYETYSIIYQCDDKQWWGTYDSVWILSRERSMDDVKLGQLVATVAERIPSYGFFQNHLMTPQPDSCEDAPEEEIDEKLMDVDQNN
eukprot:CAMPEP_0170460476 /NCGR_PEP_ID=MMETSP0123-20130129/6814_1 /TAXON_ID=182087 /ORGANISM="Favella ehrenbergii, Strain Fehren 1" /LENGTH=211 /DNA_ID=CAMNT_0010725399 /DNA_START=19 /DNA_END=654 /DNA_ORIENTATION=+